MKAYPVENLLREPTEIYTSMSCAALALLAVTQAHLFLLTQNIGYYAGLSLMAFSLIRGYQAFKIKRYHWRLKAMPYYALSTSQIPLSQKWLFLGKGFRWLPHHTQRLHQIKQIKNESFMQRGKCYQAVRDFCKNHEKSSMVKLFNSSSKLNFFRPDPPVGGSPFLHGLGERDDLVYIPQDVRVGHTFVVGTTRVGKTRLASILINQDIRNGDAVIVVDPKGDLDLVRDMYAACEVSDRLNDFRIVHLGFPELSAQYNPLKNYEQVSEVSTRITDAIAAEGEGKQFAAFAWKYVNIVAICLEEMQQLITYKSIAFYITRLDQLLMIYADFIMPTYYSEYHEQIASILSSHEERNSRKNKNAPPMDRTRAVCSGLIHLDTFIG